MKPVMRIDRVEVPDLHPLGAGYAPDPPDSALVERAVGGERGALDALVRRHARALYNLALRMQCSPPDAEDATQEILVKAVTRLSQFRGNSAFATWLYRIAVNHLLDRARSGAERAVHGFECYRDFLARVPDQELESAAPSPEERLLAEETKLGCMLGMLLCLDRSQRLVLLLGDIFEVPDTTAAAVLGGSRARFRQRLTRARRQLGAFMRGQCGLVDPRNPCRCARKTRGFIDEGVVDPTRLLFARDHLVRASARAPRAHRALEAAAADAAATALFREHPHYDPPDMVGRLRALLDGSNVRNALDLAGTAARTPTQDESRSPR